ncbi:MAG: hypothetical protein HKN62_06190 [Phycisphaerales bacterium]|nr:hypothetical protein [Phycisphaerales bacterium]
MTQRPPSGEESGGITIVDLSTGQILPVSSGVGCDVLYDGAPGTAAPPSSLGGFDMMAFPLYSCPPLDVTSVPAPGGGSVDFSVSLTHRRIGGAGGCGSWATWSHGYTGDVYATPLVPGPNPVTLTMPGNTTAFHLYVEPNIFGVFEFSAIASTGTTSGTVAIDGSSGAKYFGFHVRERGVLNSITVRNTDGQSNGYAIGEFGIARGQVLYDGTPGTAAPPPTLGAYAMDPFPPDPCGATDVSTVTTPFGSHMTFSQPLSHRRIGGTGGCGYWATWSHGYTGDVYATPSTIGADPIRIAMPPDIGAFYLYVEPNNFGLFEFTAESDTGTSSGVVAIEGSAGARYFGFHVPGAGSLTGVSVRNVDGNSAGFALGEFGCGEIFCAVGTTECETVFNGAPGTGAPPASLGGNTMTSFPLNPCGPPDVTSVPAPGGGFVGFSPSLNHRRIGGTGGCDFWATWSHGYTGDVYATDLVPGPNPVTLIMPPNTTAFYFYVEPNLFGLFEFTAVSDQSGMTSGPIMIDGASGARYFGFYVDGAGALQTITVRNSDGGANGYAIGEFGIARGRVLYNGAPGTAAPPPTLGPYLMKGFPPDPCVESPVTGVDSACGGRITFDPMLEHRRIDSSGTSCLGWGTWSHGYTGDVYYTGDAIGSDPLTITMSPNTAAFYFYVEPNFFGVFEFVAEANGSLSSGIVPIDGSSGATYFGFYMQGGGQLDAITVRNLGGSSGGFAVGEFGCAIIECGAICPWDLDYNGEVGFTDLLLVLASWGPCADCVADIDASGDVGFTDLLLVIANWGPCP